MTLPLHFWLVSSGDLPRSAFSLLCPYQVSVDTLLGLGKWISRLGYLCSLQDESIWNQCNAILFQMTRLYFELLDVVVPVEPIESEYPNINIRDA